jgi:hypothetical protein
MSQESQNTPQKPPGWRMAIAIVLIAISLGAPAFIPLVTGSGLSTEAKALLSGLLVVGIPQLLMVSAVALVGKAGFAYIKHQAMSKLSRLAPSREVGNVRYYIGLVMFFLPFLVAFLGPYVAQWVPADIVDRRLVVGLLGDTVFLASLFVLGGDFWDKLRALFVPGAKARFPDSGKV